MLLVPLESVGTSMRRGLVLRRSAVSRTVLLLVLLLVVDVLGRGRRLCRYASCVGSGGEVVRRCCCNDWISVWLWRGLAEEGCAWPSSLG